jgi:hypothetical protein
MALEAVVLVRGVRAKLVSHFPLFYSYLLAVLIQDVIRYIATTWYSQEVYADVYWSTQWVSVVMGSILLFEIYRLALQDHPGTALVARNLLGAVFGAILVKTLLTTHISDQPWVISMYVKLERDLRFVQTVAILVLIVVFLWYAIPLGRNLSAIFLGYGVFVALSVLQLTVVDHYHDKAQTFWNLTQPITYVGVVVLWVVKLWSADPVTEKNRRRTPPNGDYGELASTTGRALEEARERLGSAVRP